MANPPCQTCKPGPLTAVVLAGGGALGAYEAGVLLYALNTLAKELEEPPHFDLFAGTSVGALNASILAGHADDPSASARHMQNFWEKITFDQILGFGNKELTTFLKLLLGHGTATILWKNRPFIPAKKRPVPSREFYAPHPPVAGIFDTTPLRKLIAGLFPTKKLQQNIEKRIVRGIAMCATEVCTTSSVIFYQTAKGTEFRLGRDPVKIAKRVEIEHRHALASAAIPFLFPAVQVNGVCYTDGSLRQNTPLNPALRMGADRILVVSVTQEPLLASRTARLGCRRNPFPGALFLLGKAVNVLLSQSLDYELNRVEMYNKLIEGGEQIYGVEFLTHLNAILGKERNATFRPVQTCHIRPSRNLHQLALEALAEAKSELWLPGVSGKLLSRVLCSPSMIESDLLAYLMFTPTFIRKAFALGYDDAQKQRERLREFFVP